MILSIVTSWNPLGEFLKHTIARRNLQAIVRAKIEVEEELIVAEDDETKKKEHSEAVHSLDNMYSDLVMNTMKQGWVLTTSLLLAFWYVWDAGPLVVLENQQLWNIAGGLTVAWFVITFSSVKEIFLDSATVLTYLMFTAFTLPWTALAAATVWAACLSKEPVWAEVAFTVTPIVFAWVAAAIYDSLDLLRGNMDELAVNFFRKATNDKLNVAIKG